MSTEKKKTRKTELTDTEWTDRQTEGQTDGRTDGGTDGR